MSDTLTSWKEIAQYLGKGVRTVQRWEQLIGLPVRRPNGHVKGVVLAFSDELDTWMHSHFEYEGEPELERLRRELAEVKKENSLLRAALERAVSPANVVMPDGFREIDRVTEKMLWRRCSIAVERSSSLRLLCAEIIDMSRNLKELRKLQREDEVILPPF